MAMVQTGKTPPTPLVLPGRQDGRTLAGKALWADQVRLVVSPLQAHVCV